MPRIHDFTAIARGALKNFDFDTRHRADGGEGRPVSGHSRAWQEVEVGTRLRHPTG
jgi:hypothetical protein